MNNNTLSVKFSRGNSKMGKIPSVSLPSVITCRKDCECCKICYAKNLEIRWKNVKSAYAHNLEILRENPEKYWTDVKKEVSKNRFFRFHVSGDIPDPEYLKNMVETAGSCPNCSILCFTKRYNFVNDFIRYGGIIPKNLHIIFSGWVGLKMENPYNLPEAHVRFRNGFTEARENAVECYGNCSTCTVAGCGCWNLKNGEQVVFNEH